MMIIYLQSLSCLLFAVVLLSTFKVDSLEYWASISFILANQLCFYYWRSK
jgi:hypothetical protein